MPVCLTCNIALDLFNVCPGCGVQWEVPHAEEPPFRINNDNPNNGQQLEDDEIL